MVYNYTKPRGPIAAQYSSPGPCYQMPALVGKKSHDPRSTHQIAPAYAFGIRHGKWRDDSGPGPQYYPDPKILRSGRDPSPSYSLHYRQKDFSDDSTPGPGAYDASKGNGMVYHSAPKYSLSYRHKQFSTDGSPGPIYNVPSTLGKTIDSRVPSKPAYSLSGRSKVGGFAEDLQKTPGPGAYKVTDPSLTKSKPPGYSLTGRNLMPGDTTQIPGPGAYKPEVVYKAAKHREPAFSFGIRHSQYAGTLITATDLAA